MKWKKTMEECGLTEETVSVGLKKKIKDYYQIQNGVNQIKQSLTDESLSESEIEELQSDLQELTEGLSEADEQLSKAVLIYDKNKDKYKEMSKHLTGRGRPKKNDSTQSQGNLEPSPTPNPTPTPTPTPESTEPKKKGKFGFFALAVAIGIISLGAVSMFKNRD